MRKQNERKLPKELDDEGRGQACAGEGAKYVGTVRARNSGGWAEERVQHLSRAPGAPRIVFHEPCELW